MKHKIKIYLMLLLALTIFCTENPPPSPPAGKAITVSLTPGSEYNKHIPQMAFWLEDTSGKFIATIYVTRKSGTQSWHGLGSVRRQSALPVWSHSRGIKAKDGLYMPTREHPVPDAETGATPRSAFSKSIKLPDSVKLETCYVFAEVNSSFDYNDTYTSQTDPNYSGQPSLVFKGKIAMLNDTNTVVLKTVGHGQAQGADGKVYTDLSGITTALNIVKEIIATFKPQ